MGSLQAKDKISTTLFSLFPTHEMLSRLTHWTSKYNLLNVRLFNVYQQWFFFSFYIFLHHFFLLLLPAEKSLQFEKNKEKDNRVCRRQYIGSRSRSVVSCTHIHFLVCVGFWHCELHLDVFFRLRTRSIVVHQSRLSRESSSFRSLCECSQTVTLHTEHFLNPSAFISCIRLPLPFLPQSLM